MTEITFTTKLKFNGEISENEIKTLLNNIQSLYVYGADCGLIMPEDSEVQANKLVLSKDEHLLIRELL